MCLDCRLKASDVGLVTCGAFMGAPMIIAEKMVAGNETQLALEALQRLLASGVYDVTSGERGWEEGGRRGCEGVRVREREIGGGKKAWIAEPDDLKKIDISDRTNIDQVSLSSCENSFFRTYTNTYSFLT